MKIKIFLISSISLFVTLNSYGAEMDKNEIVYYSLSKSENPWVENASASARYTFNTAVLSLLAKMDIDFNIVPITLESFYWDYTNKYYVLKLKPSLYFTNGRKVTVADLEFSILRPFFASKSNEGIIQLINVKGVEKIVPGQAYKSGLVEGVKILDANTLAVTPSSPNPSFMYSLARSNYSLVPMEEFKEDLLHWKKWPIGVGPYKIVQEDKLKKNYILELIDSKSYPNAPQKIKFELARNEKPDITLQDGLILNDKSMNKTELIAPFLVRHLSFNFSSKLGNNPEFRKAVNFALHRHDIASKTILPTKPLNEIVTRGAIGRLSVEENYNLGKAQKLFDKTLGKLKDHVFKIPSSSGSEYLGNEYTEVIKKQLKEAGLNIEFVESHELWDTFQGEFKDSPFHLVSKGADYYDPLLTFTVFKKGSPAINAYPNDEKLFQLILDAQNSTNRDILTKNIEKLSRYFYENTLTVILFELSSVAYYNPQKIASVGDQIGGQTFHLSNIIMKRKEE
jgi:oligopeptide transport system substrate-binding protein